MEYKFLEILEEELGVNRERIKYDSRMRDFGANSINEISVLISLEEAYDINLIDDLELKAETVGELWDYIHNKCFKNNHL